MLVQAVTQGGFRGFTNRFEGWEQTVGTEGDANLRLERMREYVKAVRVQGVCLRAATNGVCAS